MVSMYEVKLVIRIRVEADNAAEARDKAMRIRVGIAKALPTGACVLSTSRRFDARDMERV